MNESLKSTFIERWRKYFSEAPLPVVFFFSDEPQDAEVVKIIQSHHCIIADLNRVFRGRSLAFNAGNIGCGGGKRYCGFSAELMPGAEFFLSKGIPGKMKGERYKKDPEIVLELMKNSPKMEAPAPWLIVKPLELLGRDEEPDVLIFFASADVLAGLFTLANYDRTDLYGVKAPFCAGCGSIIQFPWLENRRGNPDCILGMFDSSARPYVPAGVLSFAVPMKRFETLVRYMDDSFLITETWEFLRRRISIQTNGWIGMEKH